MTLGYWIKPLGSQIGDPGKNVSRHRLPICRLGSQFGDDGPQSVVESPENSFNLIENIRDRTMNEEKVVKWNPIGIKS